MKPYTIVIDTREQNPLVFKASENLAGIMTKSLNVGDYSIVGFENSIAIERKSIADLYGTLGKDNDRFQRELVRSASLDFFGIVIEGSFSDVRDKKGAHFSKMRGDVIVSILFTLMIKYNAHVFFCKDRNECSSLIRNIFNSYVRKKEKQHEFVFEVGLDHITDIQKLKRKLRIDK